MNYSRLNAPANLQPPQVQKTCTHETTDSLVDFVKAKAVMYQQKELARITGLSIQQVKNLRLGLSGISGKTLTNWIKNCPEFAGAYAEHVGIVRPGEGEYSGALTRAFQAYQRRRGD